MVASQQRITHFTTTFYFSSTSNIEYLPCGFMYNLYDIMVTRAIPMKKIKLSPEQTIKNYGKSLGFDLVGITSAKPFLRDEKAGIERIRSGMMDGIPWYTEERVRKANNPNILLHDAKSIISVAISYMTNKSRNSAPDLSGKVARYAWGDDYHDLIKNRLKKFVQKLPSIMGKPVNTRIFVDDGPMNDRAAAERAGLGWFGKNTNILTPTHGSWVILGQIITNLELKHDQPLEKNCGNCVRCIDACPTNAIVSPFVIDNTRCISFLTIELREAIPIDLRPLIGDWVFGCDICQDVCPVNRDIQYSLEPAFEQRHDFGAPALIPLLELTDDEFKIRFRNSPIKRAKLIGLQRNVCVALGNIGDKFAVPALTKCLNKNINVIVRQHAAWALGQIADKQSEENLQSALANEQNTTVRTEISCALKQINDGRIPKT